MEVLAVDTPGQIVTGALAVVVVVGTIALTAIGKPVPPELWSSAGLVLGFYFGHQSGTARGLLARK
jgi:hypothetical protein